VGPGDQSPPAGSTCESNGLGAKPPEAIGTYSVILCLKLVSVHHLFVFYF